MQTASEINSALDNIKYYIQRIQELNSKQFDEDVLSDEKFQKAVDAIRHTDTKFMRAGEIGAACARMYLCCRDIELQLAAEGIGKGTVTVRVLEEIGGKAT